MIEMSIGNVIKTDDNVLVTLVIMMTRTMSAGSVTALPQRLRLMLFTIAEVY